MTQQFGVKLDELTTGTPGVVLYGVTPDNQVIPLKTSDDGILAFSATIDASDIQIGAVELKDSTTNNRLTITGSGEALARVRLQDGSGTSLTSTLFGSKQSLDVNLAGLSGITTDTDDGAISSAQSNLIVTLPLLHGFNGSLWERLHSDAGRLLVDGSQVVQPISAASLPLPLGAATATKQDTGNNSLSSIDSKINSLGQKLSSGSIPVVLASDQSPVLVTATNTPTGNYFWWDYNVNGTTGVGTDILFDFSEIRQDVYISSDKPISVKFNSVSNTPIGLVRGQFDFDYQFASKMYITTTDTTKLQIYANG